LGFWFSINCPASFPKIYISKQRNVDKECRVFQAIFIRGVDEAVSVTEEFLGLVPMMDTTIANDIFNSLVRVLNRVGVDWPRASSMMGKKQVLPQNLEKKYRLQRKWRTWIFDTLLNFAPGGIVLQIVKNGSRHASGYPDS